MSDRKNLVPVMLIQPYKGFNAGERPGFDADEAARLVRANAAVYAQQSEDGEYTVAGKPQAKRK
jgi:hypothetical protein